MVAVSVTSTGLLPASKSLIDSTVPVADENSTIPSLSIVRLPGTLFSGASLVSASSRLLRSIVTGAVLAPPN